MADDDDSVELSAHALNALNEFYREQELLSDDFSSKKDNIDEDWELSQFWYDEQTATTLADECLRLISNFDKGARIVCICCPTLYSALKNMTNNEKREEKLENSKILLFEYDNRFAMYSDFFFYDYRQTVDEFLTRTKDGNSFRQSFDVVIADPPFISEECVGKVSELILALKKSETGKIIFCTGTVAEEYVFRGLANESMKMCQTFEPRHKRKLGNEFRCYVNYEDAFPMSG